MPNSNSTATLPDNTANLMYKTGFGEQEASEIFPGFSRQGCYPPANASVPQSDALHSRNYMISRSRWWAQHDWNPRPADTWAVSVFASAQTGALARPNFSFRL